MKKLYLLSFLLVLGWQIQAQVSVFDCGVYKQKLSQTDITNAPQQINGTCISLGENGTMTLQGAAKKEIFASEEITLKDGVHLGGAGSTGEIHLKITAKSDLNVAVMNYTDLYSVLRYKKLEFGIELPPELLTRVNHYLLNEGTFNDELNPFLAWNIDVEAVFTHIQTGKIMKVPGFYTREYVENSQTDDWDDIGTNYPFRVRFAPPENGQWRCSLEIKLKNGQEMGYQASDFYFNVIESGDLGYVKVHENKMNLKHGDRMIFPVGLNIPGPDGHGIPFGGFNDYLGHNLFSASNTEKATNTQEWEYFRNKVKSYFDEGGKYIRTIQEPWSTLIEFEQKGNYYKRLHYAYEQDKLLDLCEQYNVLMDFNFMYQTTMQKMDNAWRWDFDNYLFNNQYFNHSTNLPSKDSTTSNYYDYPVYCYNDDPSWRSNTEIHYGKKAYEMFTNASDLAYHKQRIRYYVARYGYSTNIYAFEILSEPWHIYEEDGYTPYDDQVGSTEYQLARNAVYTYHKVISEYLRDSLNINQLIGITTHYSPSGDTANIEDIVALPKLDIIGINSYITAPNDLLKNGTNSMYQYVLDYSTKHGSKIPVLISEGGTDGKFRVCSNHAMQPVDMMTFPFTGVCGFNTWWDFLDDGYADYWPPIIRSQNHMNGDDVINTLSEGGGKWGHGMEEADIKKSVSSNNTILVEHQYYGGYHADKAVGYVKNRTYNVKTNECNSIIFNDSEGFNSLLSISSEDVKIGSKISIISLKNSTKYYVDWYSYNTGVYIKTDYEKTSLNGALKLEFPTLTPDKNGNPVVWYVVHENAYSGMIQNDTPVEENERVVFDYQPIESDTTSVAFKNSIYPNPFNKKITVNSLEDDVFVISTPTGSVILCQEIHKGVNAIYVQDLPKGLYFGELKNQRFVTKLERL